MLNIIEDTVMYAYVIHIVFYFKCVKMVRYEINLEIYMKRYLSQMYLKDIVKDYYTIVRVVLNMINR